MDKSKVTKMKKLSARNATTLKQICSLQRDNYSSGNFHILIEEKKLYFSEHVPGQERSQSFVVPRKNFNKLLEWYLKEQRTRKM